MNAASNPPPNAAALKPAKPPKGPIPGWAWAFAVACGLLPVVTLGGAIPGALGLGCAAGCIEVARKATRPVGQRVAICAGLTALCWGLFVVFIVVVAMLRK